MAKLNTSTGALSNLKRATRSTTAQSFRAIVPDLLIPKRWRRRLPSLGFNRQSTSNQPPNNRKKALSPELKDFLATIDTNKFKKSDLKDTGYLCHYAYIFDQEYYLKQLPDDEADTLHCLGDFVLHYCTTGWRNGLDPSELFETNS